MCVWEGGKGGHIKTGGGGLLGNRGVIEEGQELNYGNAKYNHLLLFKHQSLRHAFKSVLSMLNCRFMFFLYLILVGLRAGIQSP